MSDTKFYLSKENAKTLVDGVKQNFSPISHTHTKGDIEDLSFDSSLSSTSTNAIQNKTVTSSLNSKVPTSRTINGKALTNNITLNATDVQADPSGSASSALASAKTYADSVGASVKNDLLNGAGLAYDTLKELGDLIETNVDAIEALEAVASGKANASHSHAISDVSGLQTSLDSKQTTITGGASTITSSNLTTNRALVSDASGKVVVSSITSTELGYLDGTTSSIQTQLDGKAASGHTHTASQISDLVEFTDLEIQNLFVR